MKKVSWMMLVVLAFAVAGCAQKSDSEKAMDALKKDANKAADSMKKNINSL